MEKLSARVRARIREEMEAKKLSQRDVAGILTWSQSHVAHVLTAYVDMTIDDLEGFSFALGVSATELVRDRGMEFCAEMTPTELRLTEELRKHPDAQAAVISLLRVKPPEAPRAMPHKKKLRKVSGS